MDLRLWKFGWKSIRLPLNPSTGEMLWINSTVFIRNVGEHVARIGRVYENLECKMWHEPWAVLMQAGKLEPDHFVDPGQTDEVSFKIGYSPVPDAKACRLLVEVELLNHPRGLRVFHYRESFELPEM